MRRANARYSSKRRSNIHTLFVVLDRWRPGFSRLEGEEFGRSTGKEIEQGEIRARAFFASNRPLNDRERRFLLRDLLPFSLSARHDFSFPLSLSLSPYLRLSLSSSSFFSLLYFYYLFHQHEARRHDASIRERTGSFFFFIKAIQAVGGV